ncbi:MAG: leucine-rich repeat domain-containing protein [Flavobacteriales bacterium]
MKFKSIYLILCGFLLINTGLAQVNILTKEQLDTCKVYISLEAALKNPEQVYVLNLSKAKITELSADIGKLKNLNVLLLSKNKLKTLPAEIRFLQNLQIIDLGKNSISIFPDGLTQCTSLRKLILNQNPITALPYDIKNLANLEYLDLWGSEMTIFPESLGELKNLKEIDLRVIGYNIQEKKNITTLLPGVKIHFSNTCNCGG